MGVAAKIENLEEDTGSWRAAVRELETRILDQMRADREAGKTVTMGGKRHRLASMTIDEMRPVARQEAIDRTEEAIRREQR